MSTRYSFQMESQERRHPLPRKVIIGQQDTETINHVALKFLAYVLFYRERLQVETNLHQDAIPFVPDLVQLDYELRPRLWVECGECGVNKLNKLAVKVPEAEIWVVKKSLGEAEYLYQGMAREELRRERYQLIGLDAAMFQEFIGFMRERNEFVWFSGGFEPATMQFEFNGLWFDTAFTVLKF